MATERAINIVVVRGEYNHVARFWCSTFFTRYQF